MSQLGLKVLLLVSLISTAWQPSVALGEQSSYIQVALKGIETGGIRPEAFAETIDFSFDVKIFYFEHVYLINGVRVGQNRSLEEKSVRVATSPRLRVAKETNKNELKLVNLSIEISTHDIDRALSKVPNPDLARLVIELNRKGIIGQQSIARAELSPKDVEAIIQTQRGSKVLILDGIRESKAYLTIQSVGI